MQKPIICIYDVLQYIIHIDFEYIYANCQSNDWMDDLK